MAGIAALVRALVDDWNKLLWVALLAVLLTWLAGLKSLVRVSEAEMESSAERPNILVLVADDLGYNDVSTYNPTGFSTPHIDRIAAEGVAFTRHYADATCSPSRVAMLTGREPERSGFRHRGIMIPDEFNTIAESLNKYGYHSYLVGKWHAGEELRAGWPDRKGFTHWFGFLNQWHLQGGTDLNWPTYINPWLRRDGGAPKQYRGHLTDILTQHTVDKIQAFQKSDKPWFLYHAFLAPHTPIQPDARYLSRYPNTEEGAYLALLNQLDDSVGKILDAVGDDPNTIVVFVSDNGGTNERRDNNYPFAGKKNEIYEGSYRTPLVMKLPGRPRGQRIHQVVMNTDIYPTIMAAAGLQVPGDIDGRNLLPLLAGHDSGPRARSWEMYSWNVESMNFSVLAGDGQWRMSNLLGLKNELFDLQASPSGGKDIAGAHPAQVADLERLYKELSWDKSRVNVKAQRRGSDTYYSGFNALRTPTMFGFGIGLEIPPLDQLKKSASAVLAEQRGAWKLHLSAGNVLNWEVGGQVLQSIDFNRYQCNRVVLTGHFQPESLVYQVPSSSSIKLFVNGQLMDASRDVTHPLVSERVLSRPTKVYHHGQAYFVNQQLSSYSESYSPLVEPQHKAMFIESHRDRRLAMPSLERLDQQLCVGG
ncbi:sulfatase-like hydrolase/transferase [Ketobacter sp. MCCC 1A13808]|uniref:sulfatase family protein n=1 Tax=Ketobacter sp. MCCC 1A13808 TaxID=2602738 RepID=UPI0012EC09BB|nr:sulfatase-like hydrolase/transferase [Ketobacter sp. MCCC 1A13808]MVF13769.1 sulfatase-like hydrolase/transferase [Ketobacter sp. MCCC 1A13808]